MSSSLIARPTNPNGGISLPTELKFVLRKKFGEPIDVRLRRDMVPYLEGVADCGIDGAKALSDYILEHDDVQIIEEY